jgi:hypothetical protein
MKNFAVGGLNVGREYGIIYASSEGVDLKGGYSSRSVWWVKRRMKADPKNQPLSVYQFATAKRSSNEM